jgi:8-oxo-dGTP pyrophosphatase MutT (NUDIX family)
MIIHTMVRSISISDHDWAVTLRFLSSQGMVGEHSTADEPWLETARRALREELGLPADVVDKQRPRLLLGSGGEQSVLVRTEYTAERRRELQATALVAVVLSDDAVPLITPDDEVAETRWLTYGT